MRKSFIFKPSKRLFLVWAFFALTLVLLVGCGEKAESTNQDTTVTSGNWLIDASGLDASLKVTAKEITESESSAYQTSDFELLGLPVSLSANDQENVRLTEPIHVTLKLPEEVLEQLNNETLGIDELFFGYYYDGIWEPYFPTEVDLVGGTATFEVYHFSKLGFGKPSEAEQIEAYAETSATKEWMKDKRYSEYIEASKTEFDNMFKEMGIQSEDARNQLMVDVISFVDDSDLGYFDYMAQSLKMGTSGAGSNTEFENKYKEFLGKALYEVVRKDPSKFSSKVNVVGNLATAAGALSGGDNRAALEAIANMINGAFPVAQLATSTSKFVAASMEASIDYWTQAEIEKAYQVYKTGIGGKWGYEDGLQGDFDTIFTLMGGSDRQLDLKVVAKYCERRGMDPNALSDEQRQNIINQAKASLKANFDYRITADEEVAKVKAEEVSFWSEVKKAGLLNASSNMTYFGIEKGYGNYSIQERLDRLSKVKATVLGLMDDEVAATMDDATLVKVMSQWLYWSEKKDRDGFYKYMRDLGYIKEPLKMTGGTWVLDQVIPVTNDAGWAALDAHESYAFKPSYGEGSYSLTWTYEGETDNYYNPPYVNGESFSVQGTHDIPPTTLTPGTEVTVNIAIEKGADSLSAFYPSGSIRAWFAGTNMTTAEGNYFFEITKSISEMSGILTAVVPDGSKDATLEIEFSFYSGESMGTRYVYGYQP